MSTDFINVNDEELVKLDTLFASRASDWWNGFYEDRAKPCPFFVESPDESLVQWVDDGLVLPGKALDLGCGNGRNSIFLARRGFAVEGVDYSQQAIGWADEHVRSAGVSVRLRCQSVFDLECDAGSVDLVYDGGCFHHMPPHRRRTYVELVTTALKPGGWFGMTCFRPEGGSGYSDDDVYERSSRGGGLGYTEERMRAIWGCGLQVRVVRQMKEMSADSGLFGQDFLWVLLAQKVA